MSDDLNFLKETPIVVGSRRPSHTPSLTYSWCNVQALRWFEDAYGKWIPFWSPVGRSRYNTDSDRQSLGIWRINPPRNWYCTDLPGNSDNPHLLIPAKVTDVSARGFPGCTELFLYCETCDCLADPWTFDWTDADRQKFETRPTYHPNPSWTKLFPNIRR